MRGRLRELEVAAIIAALAAGGIAFDLGVDPGAPAVGRSAEAAFVERATFCPPAPVEADGSLKLAIAAPADAGVRVGTSAAVRTLAADRLLLAARDLGEATAVTGYGAPVAVTSMSALSRPVSGAAAARCSQEASTTWYFPDGSSALGIDQRLLVHNPFLDEAVVRVTFHTPEGPRVKAGLADLAVPAGETIEIAVNEFILRQSLLSATVEAERGRVVAWRVLFGDRRRGGVEATLGAPRAARVWYLADGAVGPGFDERITVLNPSAEEATVTVTLADSERVVQPRRLVEVSVAPQSSRSLSLADLAPRSDEPVGVSASVSAANGVPVVAERTVVYSGRRRGTASEVGADRVARRWILAPAAARPRADTIVVMNPGLRDALVDIALIGPGEIAQRPRSLQAISIPAGLRVAVGLSRWTEGRPRGAIVTADAGVVAERRSSTRGDVAALLGVDADPGG